MPRPASPAYGERVLRLEPPITGRDVWELQIKLIAWGSGLDPDGIGSPNMPVVVNGSFDRATRDAVMRFQHAVNLPLTGIVDDATFAAIDLEAALWPVIVWDMRCPCADGGNAPPIRCRCNQHPSDGVCAGFGNARFAGQFSLDGITQPDGTSLAAEHLDIYDKREYDGVDKALIWAVRGLMRRANVRPIKVAVGYRCWQANYQATDSRRWQHRKSTFHLGKMVEFYVDGTCAEYGQNQDAGPCRTCVDIRTIALTKCGFQERWQEPDRVTACEVGRTGPPPFNPFAVSLSTVRRREREVDEFVNTYHASVQPLYAGKAPGFSYPVDIDAAGLDIRKALSAPYFANTENANAGWYPCGSSRIWHPAVHLYVAAGTEVRAMADGEIVGLRAGELATAKTLGSRNFVLIRHKHQNVVWYSLNMHLDGGAINAASQVPWRKKLHAQTVDHILFVDPSPAFTHRALPAPSRLIAGPGYAAGDRIAKARGAAAVNPRTALDAAAPLNSQVIQLADAADTYAYLKMDNENLATEVAADAGLNGKINAGGVIGLDHPIRVAAGELIGYVGAAPSEASLQGQGAFLHLEAFSETQILAGDGYTLIDAGSASEFTDRKKVVLKLKAAGLLTGLPADVWLADDVNNDSAPLNLLPMRSVVLKAPNQWALDWTAALAAATSLSFMQDGTRNALGDRMNEYRWWADVQGNHRLPASSTVFHYHPLALMLHFAFA